MNKDVNSRSVANSGRDGDQAPHSTDSAEAELPADAASPHAAGKPASQGDGAVTGSGQSTGFGNPGEQPDVDPKGGDGSSLLAANLRKSSQP